MFTYYTHSLIFMGKLCFWLFDLMRCAKWSKDGKVLNLKDLIWHAKQGKTNGQIKQGPKMLNFGAWKLGIREVDPWALSPLPWDPHLSCFLKQLQIGVSLNHKWKFKNQPSLCVIFLNFHTLLCDNIMAWNIWYSNLPMAKLYPFLL